MAGGIDWFRWHHGSVTDPKFALVAKRSRAALGNVITVWAFLLEAASASADRGEFGAVDAEAVDLLLGADDGTTDAILAAMEARGLIADGRIASWEKRQPKREREADSSTDRVRAFRERQRHETPGNATERQETPRGEERRVEKSTEAIASVGARAPRPAKKCPESFVVTDQMRAWAVDNAPLVLVDSETDRFRDHTFSTAASDWPGRWRNWMRKAQEFAVTRPAGRGPPVNRQEAQEARNRAVGQEWARGMRATLEDAEHATGGH